MSEGSKVCVVILTFNSEASLELVVKSCESLGPRIVVVDSFSQDSTIELAKTLGCEVIQHEFINYAAQRNWAQTEIGLSEGWYLHLDSDEVLSQELQASIQQAIQNPTHSGYLIKRAPYFLGKRIRYGAINPTWHLRLYQAGKGQCEDRLYDQHFVMDQPAGKLKGDLLDLQLTTLEAWTAAHNRWSTAEANEVFQKSKPTEEDSKNVLKESLTGDSRMRKRWIKNKIWYGLPLLARPYLFFFYSYVLKFGFLDGKEGLIYHTLQSFWFRFLVDAKLYEKRSPRADREALTSDSLIRL